MNPELLLVGLLVEIDALPDDADAAALAALLAARRSALLARDAEEQAKVRDQILARSARLRRVRNLRATVDAGLGFAPAGVWMHEVEREDVRWLWEPRIPLGKVASLEGDPDVGKTTLAVDLAARVTTGKPMPGEEQWRAPAGVVIISAEDDVADTLRPRLEAAGADLTRVRAFRLDELPEIPGKLDDIERNVGLAEAKLVVLDPIMAFLADRTDSHRDHHVRRALAPLAALAQRTGAAILIIRHLNKSGGSNSKYRGGGSIGITGATRAALLAARDTETDECVLARIKGNLGPDFPSLRYDLEAIDGAVRVRWGETTTLTANDLLAAAQGRRGEEERPEERSAREDDRNALEDACDFLRVNLSRGWRSTRDLKAAAADAGVKWRTIERAKCRLNVRAAKAGLTGPWGWQLGAPAAEDRQPAVSIEGWRSGGLWENPENLPKAATPPSSMFSVLGGVPDPDEEDVLDLEIGTRP